LSRYKLTYEEDGVYLELLADRENEAELDRNELLQHLSRKKIVNLSISCVQNLLEEGCGRERIAITQEEHFYGEDLIIDIKKDEMTAEARLIAPETNGPVLGFENAKIKLNEAGVIHGIDDEALRKMLDGKDYGEPYVVARATPSEDGEDGRLVFHFSTDPRTGSPVEIGGGRVDYRVLDLFIPVTEGQLLVTKTDATEGQPGSSVRGNLIKQRYGKEAVLPRGKNIIINEDRTEISASSSGMVEYVNNSINVSNVYNIKGDCDMSVGNIDFDGSVHISGSVRSGHTVKATGGISVAGSVEAAKLIAGGNIEVKGGMQGSGKGSIEAGGTVSIMYVEQGVIYADGPVTIDVSIHSRIESGSTIHAKGKRGAIIGGHAAAAGDIIVNFIGTLSGTKTDVEVGVMPRKRARVLALEKEMEKNAADKIKLNQLDAYLEKTKGTMDNETWTKLHLSGVENRRINEDNEHLFTLELEELKYEIEHATENKIHVFETAFSGSRITIGKSTLKIDIDTSFATFKYSDGEVRYNPCELSKGDKR